MGGNVFLTEEGQPYATEKAQRVAFTKALRKLGIRHRKQYNTRHSYATALLMAGANPMFVANQLGHSLQVLLKTYAKWIHGEADRRELDKLQSVERAVL
jgi:integrase